MAVLTPVPSDNTRPVDDDLAALGRHWGLFVVSGCIGLVVGILVLAYPDVSLKLLGVFLGIDLLLVGILMLIRGVSGDGESAGGPGAILLGALGIIAGVLVIRNPGHSIALVVLAFALFLIVAGAIALGHGLVRRERRGITLVRGVVLVGLGTLIVAWPELSLGTLVVLSGISLIVQGVIEIAEGLALRAMRDRTAEA
jgi:uncharacterized membrane protein HdeD (DUF308 family)